MSERARRLLLVEANAALRGELLLLLARMSLQVRAAATATQAKALAAGWLPDLGVVADRLPDGSGVQLCRELIAIWPGMRVLLHATMITPALEQQARAAGVHAVVLKGYRCEGLLAALADLTVAG